MSEEQEESCLYTSTALHRGQLGLGAGLYPGHAALRTGQLDGRDVGGFRAHGLGPAAGQDKAMGAPRVTTAQQGGVNQQGLDDKGQ